MSSTPALLSIHTQRLLLRRPLQSDATSIFSAYANDKEVTRYLGWARHQTLDDTLGFLQFCEQSWEQNQVGAYLIFDKSTSELLGSTGLELESDQQAGTGYVLKRSAWNRGYASEALRAILDVASATRIQSVYALCHPDHRASAHVLEKCGFTLDARLPSHTEFPNLEPGRKQDVLRYMLATSPA